MKLTFADIEDCDEGSDEDNNKEGDKEKKPLDESGETHF